MPVSYRLDVSLPVLKELTFRLADGQTYDDVLREILKVDSITEPERPDPFPQISAAAEAFANAWAQEDGGFQSRGLRLPNGTKLRARYKQRAYSAEIKNGQWVNSDGQIFGSPSAAATAITKTNVNGLRFWDAQRPGEDGWRRLEVLVS